MTKSTALILLAACAAGALANPFERIRRGDCTTFSDKQSCEEKSDEADNCEWAGTTPGEYDEANFKCQSPSCATLNYAPGDVTGECKALNGQNGGLNCEWNEDVYYCLKAGDQPPCGLFYADPDSGEQCPSYCDYDTDAGKCEPKGQTAKCSEIYDQDKCSGSCTWHDDIYKCWDSGQDVPCVEYHYMDKDTCPSQCKFVETTPKSGDFDAEGICIGTSEEVACDEFICNDEEGKCCPTAHCKFYEYPLNLCWAKDRKVPCEKQPGQLCAPDATCKWYPDGSDVGMEDEGICGVCPAGDTTCVTKWDGPTDNGGGGGADSGADCNTYTGAKSMDCPEPRCYLQYDDSNGAGMADCGGGMDGNEGTCRNPVCEDLQYDEEACTGLKDSSGAAACDYSDTTNICRTKGGKFPCSEVYDESDCPTGDGCSYDPDEMICFETGNRPCNSHYDGDKCSADSSCKWIAQEYMCVDASVQQKCIDFGTEGTCPPAQGCEWKMGKCWEQGEDIPCSAFCTGFSCEATGKCFFNQDDYTCKDCVGGQCPVAKDCTTYTTEETCPEAHCEFQFSDETQDGNYDGGSCVKKQCVDAFEEAECTGKGCDWTPSTFEGEGHCSEKGYAIACSMLYDQDECTGTCVWDEANYRCNEQGASTPCEMYTVESCPTDRCLKDEDNYMCKIDDSKYPSTPPPMTGAGDGTGNEDSSLCTPAKYDLIKAKLETAENECIDVGRRSRRDDKQLECLSYFLQQSPAISMTDACPCLWFWGKKVAPMEDHWMEIKC